MKKAFSRGFTLIELLVVLSVISSLLLITIASVNTVRARSRDAQVKTDKQILILALVRAKDANSNNQYPVAVGSGACLKASGTCWANNMYTGSQTIADTLAPYVPGAVIPRPPGTAPSQHRHDAYVLYRPTGSFAGFPAGSTFLIWAQEKNITASECNGQVSQHNPGIWYCYEKLP